MNDSKTESEKIFLEALLNNLSDSVVACDVNGNLAVFNRASQEFFPIPSESLPPNKWAEYYSLYDSEGKRLLTQQEIPLLKAFSGESFVDLELTVVKDSGELLAFSVNGNPIVDNAGDKLGAVVTVRNITQRRKIRQEIVELNERLESKVRQRTTQLREANESLLDKAEQLKKSNQELEQFAYVASHDLKAPLRGIFSLVSWIEEDLQSELELSDELNKDISHNIDLLKNRVLRLANLIDGLLNYSRVGRVKPKPKPVDVKKMLLEIIDSLDTPKNFQIEVQEPMPSFVTNVIPLEQVFSNLIANCIKHGNCSAFKKEQPRITISATEKGEFYEFRVADNGKGIAKEYHDRIFTIFQTLQSRDTVESTGIGLSIVKKIVEEQEGSIRVESQLSKGATFVFTWKKNLET